MTLNCRPEVWGEDAMEFKPERWLESSAAVRDDTMPGWEGVANFSTGHRLCVGAGFALMASDISFRDTAVILIPVTGDQGDSLAPLDPL